jgi:hypothetical protein
VRGQRSARPETTSFVEDVPLTWAADQYNSSPDLSAIVQEIVARPDWKSGHALALFIADNGSDGQRALGTRDDRSERAAALTVTYGVPRVGTLPPGAERLVVNLFDSITLLAEERSGIGHRRLNFCTSDSKRADGRWTARAMLRSLVTEAALFAVCSQSARGPRTLSYPCLRLAPPLLLPAFWSTSASAAQRYRTRE